MKRWPAIFVLIALSAVACGGSGDRASENTAQEDGAAAPFSGVTAVVNARVYTVNEAREWADAFAYDATGRIIAVGAEGRVLAAAQQLAGSRPEIIDAQGALVLPGFQDPHVHVLEAGLNLELCLFPGGLELDDYEAVAIDCAAQQADSDWVRGAGASLFDLRDTDESPRDVLDRAIPDRPALILDDLGHAIWTNSAGLAAAGIDEDMTDPQGGVLHRDGSGALTGLILEDAQHLVRNAAALDAQSNYEGLLVALEELASNGVTTVSDAGGYWAQDHRNAWVRAETEGTLTARARNTLYVYPASDFEQQLADFEAQLLRAPNSLLQFDTAKMYVDGILDLGTALMLEPYDVPVDTNYPQGFAYFETEVLEAYVDALHQRGFQINFHAIGDAAVRQALDAVEAIDAPPEQIADRRHRTTHTYLVDGEDLPRFQALGVVADLQQSGDAVATDYHDYLSEFIGDRAYGLIPTADLLAAGATVTLSSDWDAGPLSPLGTIERSLTRDANAVPDLETAVAMVTIEAAYALGHDDQTGSIEVGKLADFVLLDRNIFDGAVDEIADANVVMTVVDGKVVFEG